ncbi:MAG TPA: tail fiber domain-containing protein [Flavobacteriales bacterium]|nr:tail fiber domain-containing protein [Flavobacteriales bacterium]
MKENVTDLSDALGVIDQLSPKSYDYLVEEYPQLGLPTGQQYGFMAQDLEQAIPEAVKDITFQATLDSAGQVLYPALSTKIVNTDAVIPFLVAAIKEQQQQIAAMQAQLDQCCATNPGLAPEGNGTKKHAPATGELQEQRLLVVPNPVAELTTLEYYVPTAGRVVLQVATLDGKSMVTLREEMAEAGAYSYTWNTGKLAAGTYFCTYLLDGAVVVQRAVKVK